MRKITSLLSITLLPFIFTGCAVNPVTGEQELRLISEHDEIRLGNQHYIPSQQLQGGEYILDKSLSNYVKQVGRTLASKSARPSLPYDFVVVNDSTPNAWALPGGKIGIHRGLLTKLNNEAELAAVLGHEVIHSAARHQAKGQERNILLQTGVAILGASVDANARGLAMGSGQMAAQLISSQYSRNAELEADEYGMKLMTKAGYDPSAAVELQKTFVELNKQRAQGWRTGLFDSHPPSTARVAANQRHAAGLPQGMLNKSNYQRKIAYLKRTENAYEQYQKGKKELSQKRPQTAINHANKAIAVEPKEALFYGLKGDAYQMMGKSQQAEQQYNKAIRLNPNFYEFYLGRGLVRHKKGQDRSAMSDLEKSLSLLPTATGHYALGLSAMNLKQYRTAYHHFNLVSQGRNPYRNAAIKQLKKLKR